jgi:DNA-binding SARP family transcriptional activator
MLRFSILGPIEICGDDGELGLTAPRERVLLALLLLDANRVVSTDHLKDRLWGERPPPAAGASLQNGIAALRKVLGADLIEQRRPGYVLHVEPEQLDLARFERLRERARAEAPLERAATLREALALWRGEPLADLAFEPGVQDDIRHLARLRVDALEERLGADLELGRYAEVVPELETLVAAHGDRQVLVRHLMLALHQAGRDIEANDAFHACSRRLDEVGLLPGIDLQDLHRRILRHDPSLQPPHAGHGQHVPDRYSQVVRAILAARLVPVLGPGAASSTESAPPDPAAAAARLSQLFDCPPERAHSLTRVSQYVAVTHGVGPLYDELHTLYASDYPPGPVHQALAALPPLLRSRNLPLQVLITTSFDRRLERAFAEAGEEVDVLSYVALGRDRGKFVHRAPDGSTRVIDEPNVDVGLTTEQRTLVLKIHGTAAGDGDSYVVSEDDYIDFLAHTPLSALLPVGVAARLSRSHFLFLGYDLDDWSPRVFLRRLWGNERIGYRSWAIGGAVDPVAVAYWSQCGVEAFDVPLDEYLEGLYRQLEPDPPVEAVA